MQTYPFNSLLEHFVNEEREVFRRFVIQVHKVLKILEWGM